MSLPFFNSTANDNAPEHVRAKRISQRLQFQGPYTYDSAHHPSVGRVSGKAPLRDSTLMIGLTLWAASVVFAGWGLLTNINYIVQIIASFTVIWTGLWIGYLGQDRGQQRLGDFGTFTSIVGFATFLMIIVTKLSLPLSITDGLCILAVVSIIATALTDSRLCLVTSASLALFLTYMHMNGAHVSPYAILAFPLLWSLQIYQAIRLYANSISYAIVGVGYFWLVVMGYDTIKDGLISADLALSLLFLIGLCHYRAGKTSGDIGIYGVDAHTLMGWCVAVTTATMLQISWLSSDTVLTSAFPDLPSVSQTPPAIILTAGILFPIIGLIISSMMRWQYGYSRLVFIPVILMVGLCVPLLTIYAEPVAQYLDTVPALYNIPVIALLISGAITASAIVMIFKSNQGNGFLAFAGFCALGAQAIILYRPEVFQFEAFIIFSAMTLFSLGIHAIFSTSYAQAPIDPFKI